MSYRLTEGNKVRLKGKIVKGAQNFEKYLNGKCFKIICEDGMQTEIRFFQDDFKHLTGIESNLNITVRQSRQSGVARATCPD